jgi:hypothetical protein
MMNIGIKYTDTFHILTYPLGTNSVVVMSPDCTLLTLLKTVYIRKNVRNSKISAFSFDKNIGQRPSLQ